MGGKPAARKTDLTVHAPVVVTTGSPDTTVEFLKAARLNDLTAPCPVCKVPKPGKIVSTSKTVFINRLGAARVTDKVACGAGAAPPGGCSHPGAKGYQVRGEDHYEKLMKGEHESSKFDEVTAYDREDYDGEREEAVEPVGIAPSGGGLSASRPTGGAASGGGSGAKPHPSDGSANPHAGKAPAGKRTNAAALGSSGQGGGGVGGTDGALGGGKQGKAGAKESEEDEKHEEVELDIEFSMDLSFGGRGGSAGSGGGPNAVAKGASTVFIGS